jgi:hypothetical protein
VFPIEPFFVIGRGEKVKELVEMRKFTIAWYQANPEYVAEQNRFYASQKSKPSAHKARAKKLNRMPDWVDEAKLKRGY